MPRNAFGVREEREGEFGTEKKVDDFLGACPYSLRVPFIFQQLNYPARGGPFPSRVVSSSAGPQTLFISVIKPRRRDRPHIETHVSIPSIAQSITFNANICNLNDDA